MIGLGSLQALPSSGVVWCWCHLSAYCQGWALLGRPAHGLVVQVLVTEWRALLVPCLSLSHVTELAVLGERLCVCMEPKTF